MALGWKLHIGENNRKLPGTGSTDWDGILKALKDVEYKETISFEPFIISGGEVADAVSLWRDLTEGATPDKVDEMFLKSIEFIKNRMYMIGN